MEVGFEVEVGGGVVVGPVPPEPGLELLPLVVGIPPPGPVGLPLPVLVGAPLVLIVVVPPAGQDDGLDGPVVVVDTGEVLGVEIEVVGGLEDTEVVEVADVAVVDEHCPEYAVTPF